jgi:hypothetical protein
MQRAQPHRGGLRGVGGERVLHAGQQERLLLRGLHNLGVAATQVDPFAISLKTKEITSCRIMG